MVPCTRLLLLMVKMQYVKRIASPENVAQQIYNKSCVYSSVAPFLFNKHKKIPKTLLDFMRVMEKKKYFETPVFQKPEKYSTFSQNEKEALEEFKNSLRRFMLFNRIKYKSLVLTTPKYSLKTNKQSESK